MVAIPPQLQIQPELRGHTQEPLETQRRVGRNAPLPVHELVDPGIGNPKSGGQLSLRQSQGPQELLPEHLARVGRRPMCRDQDHAALLVVVTYLYLSRPGRRPHKAHPELLVHANGVLPLPIALQGLEPVARRHPQRLAPQ